MDCVGFSASETLFVLLLAMVVTPFIVYLFFILYVKFVKPKEIMTYSLLHSDAK